MAESLALSLKLQGFEEAQVALGKLGTNGAQAQKQVEAATRSTTATVGQFGRAMSSVAAIAAASTGILSIFARNNAELQDKLEKATVALSLASVAMRGLGAAARFVVTPIGAVVTAIGAAVAVFLNWDRISRAVASAAVATWRALGDFFSRLIGNLAELFGGLGAIIAGAFTFDLAKIRAGFDQVAAGAAGVKTQFVEVGIAAVEAGKAGAAAIGAWLTGLLAVKKEIVPILGDLEDLAREFAFGLPAAEPFIGLGALLPAPQLIEEATEAILGDLEDFARELELILPAGEPFLGFGTLLPPEVPAQLEAIPQRFRDISDAANLSAADTQTAWTTFSTWFGTQMTTIQDISRATWGQLSSGLGQAVAQSVIFGESLGGGLKKVMQGIGAAIIKMIVEIAAQWVISNAIMAASSVAKATTDVTAAAVTGGAWAWAAAIKKFGLVGVIAGALIAAVVIAGIIALLSQIGSAQGGLENVPDTGTFRLHRGERILSRRQNLALEEFMGEGGAGGPQIVIHNHFSNVVMDELGVERFERKMAQRIRSRLAGG